MPGSAVIEEDVSRETAEYEESPIEEAARRATEVRSGDLTLPRPRRRRVMTISNQKGGVEDHHHRQHRGGARPRGP